MTTTLDPPLLTAGPPPDAVQDSKLDELRSLEHDLEQHSSRRDNWTVMMFGVAIVALLFSVMAVGFGVRAIDESKRRVQTGATAPVAAPGPPVPAALSSVALSDMKVTPSSNLIVSGTYTVRITNSGKMPHELLVFHTDVAPANLPVGPDGKVAEDAPGFKVSDGDNLDPGASQSRVIDLTQPGTYLFVCNLPGHFTAGMYSIVTVK